MSGDYTRHTFREHKHYSGVRLQQGRVQLDADWNEQVDIAHHVDRVTTGDVVGSTGVPEDAPGFEVTAADGDLLLGVGQAYVNGILVEHDAAPATTLTKVSGNGVNTVWEVSAGPRLTTGQWLDDGTASPPRVKGIEPPVDGDGGRQRLTLDKDLGPGPAEVRGLVSVAVQPDLPGVALPQDDGQYLAYLDVWEREITFLEDPAIQESALGEPDTGLRTKVIWQVKLLKLKDLIDSGAVSNPPVCADFEARWHPNGGAPRTRLAARTNPGDQDPNPCVLPSSGGYRSLENHLYRVEIHAGGQIGQDTVFLKWSRDNGIHRTRLLDVKDGSLVVESSGRDAVTAVRPDDWVEVLDERRILAAAPGFFVRVGEVNDDRLEIKEVLDPDHLQPLTQGQDPDTGVLPKRGLVRRWEGGKPVEAEAGKWIRLENEIEVQVTAGLATSTDYWLIPARTLKARIEWPVDPGSGDPAFQRPLGVRHQHAALALVKLFDGAWSVQEDCRDIFPPLTRQASLFYVSGDGQEATPDPAAPNQRVPLGEPLIVGVARGSTPVEGATVRFEVTGGDGRLTGDAASVEVRTGLDGTAQVDWSVDGAMLDQHVRAELLDSAGRRRHLPLIFTGRLSRAGEVSFDPSACPDLAGSKTVQLAIDTLCKLKRGGCATYVVTPESDWVGLLQSLRPKEDAHVCFQRGQFKARQSVELKNLGHISFSGAGDGTVIEVSDSETALHFIDCKSVSIGELCVSAPEGSQKLGEVKNLNGTLMMTGCPRVEIQNASVKCGAGASTERTCITVKPQKGGRVDSIRIVGNHLTVGYGQIGLLLTSAVRATVVDNELVVAKRPKSLTFERLIAEPGRRAQMVSLLVRRAVLEEHVPSKDKAKILIAGRFTARFASAIPESEWRLLRDSDPPQADDKKDKESFGRYVERLVAKAVDKPELLPSYKRQLDSLGTTRLTGAVKRGLAISGEVDVKHFTELQDERRDVALVLDNHRVQFDSPVSDADWHRILKRNRADDARSNYELLGNIRRSAARLVVDAPFRRRFPSVMAWFDALKQKHPSVGDQGIVCGGEVLTDVRIRGNTLRGFREGIHVGVSKREQRGEKPLMAGSVSIRDNWIELRAAIEEAEGRYGVFVGNVRRITVQNNELINRFTHSHKMYREGIRVWGYLGPFAVLRENSTRNCRYSIRVRTLKAPKKRLWRAVDNLAINGHFDVPGFLQRDNEEI